MLASPSDEKRLVLVRIFGATDVFSPDDRARENSIFAELARCGIAPRLVALFANGRIEEWLDARHVDLPEMTEDAVLTGVAVQMARLHRFQPPDALGLVREPTVWKQMDQWLRACRALQISGGIELDGLEREIASLRKVLCALAPADIVFAHNDLLAGNILRSNADPTSVRLIDYEYSGYNYRAFDIGNFFCECMGGTTDGHVDRSRYPTTAQRERFCRAYLDEQRSSHARGPATDNDVRTLAEKAHSFGMLSHLYWATWALAQSARSTVDFPYTMFARERFAVYTDSKQIEG